jgi:hypothetical protein
MTQESASVSENRSTGTAVTARLRELLRRFDPTILGLLGLLSVPSYVFDSLVLLRVFSIFYIFFLWMLVGPLVDAVLSRGTDEETEPTDWLQVGSVREFAVGYLMIPLTLLNPLVFAQDIIQGVGGLVTFVRYRGSIPDAEGYDQQVDYRLPVEGTWTVVNGSPEREHSHSWIYPNQRYAYDLLITDEEGRSRPEEAGPTTEEYYCYDEPVLAPADGVVVDTFDAVLESDRAGGLSHPLKRSIPGGHVVIRHADSEYSFLAHLRPGSVTVEPGDRVTRGQQVGRCGHSGNSSEPHLHFQVQDRANFVTAASLPVQFADVTVESPGVTNDPDIVPGQDAWHPEGDSDPESNTDGAPDDSGSPPETHHDRTFVIERQRVTHAASDESGDPANQTPDSPPPEPPVGSTGHRLAEVLRRAAYGLAVAGIVTFLARTVTSLANIALSGVAVAAVLGSAALVGLVFHYVFGWLRGDRFQTRGGSVGTPLGLGLAAVAVAGATQSGAVGVGPLVGILLFAGVVGYYLVSEYHTRRLLTMGRGAASG